MMNLPSQVAVARYGAVKVTTASPAAILVMLYDGLLRFCREAHGAMTAGDRRKAGQAISRAQAILQHLLGSLDFSKSQQLCERLQGVYLFCVNHLLRANIEQNPQKIDDVVRMLSPLRDAWSTAAVEVAKAGR
jgi:flagellar protein FliS